jgi:hypothetical protein
VDRVRLKEGRCHESERTPDSDLGLCYEKVIVTVKSPSTTDPAVY